MENQLPRRQTALRRCQWPFPTEVPKPKTDTKGKRNFWKKLSCMHCTYMRIYVPSCMYFDILHVIYLHAFICGEYIGETYEEQL